MRLSNPWVAVVAILTLGAIELMTLRAGCDGTLQSAAVAAIAGLAGYAVQPNRRH